VKISTLVIDERRVDEGRIQVFPFLDKSQALAAAVFDSKPRVR
jgi:hypothetical protein